MFSLRLEWQLRRTQLARQTSHVVPRSRRHLKQRVVRQKLQSTAQQSMSHSGEPREVQTQTIVSSSISDPHRKSTKRGSISTGRRRRQRYLATLLRSITSLNTGMAANGLLSRTKRAHPCTPRQTTIAFNSRRLRRRRSDSRSNMRLVRLLA